MRIQRKYAAILGIIVLAPALAAPGDATRPEHRTTRIHRLVDAILESTIREGQSSAHVAPYLHAALIVLDAAALEPDLIDPDFSEVPVIHELIARPARLTRTTALGARLRTRLGLSARDQQRRLEASFSPSAAGWSEDQHPPRHRVDPIATLHAMLAVEERSCANRVAHRLLQTQLDDGTWPRSEGLDSFEATLTAIRMLHRVRPATAPMKSAMQRAASALRRLSRDAGIDEFIVESPNIAISLADLSGELGLHLPFELDRREAIECKLYDRAFAARTEVLGPMRIERLAAALAWAIRNAREPWFDVVEIPGQLSTIDDPFPAALARALDDLTDQQGQFRSWAPTESPSRARLLLLHGSEEFDLRLPSDQTRDLRAFQAAVNAHLATRFSNGDPPPPLPSSPVLATLRESIRAGATMVAIDDSPDGSFSRSVFDLGTALFPDRSWHRVRIQAEAQPNVRWCWMLDNGVRPLMMLLPHASGSVDSAERLAELLSHHVLDRWSDNDGTRSLTTPRLDPPVTSFPRPVPTIARGVHGGNWNPEPGALRRLRAHRITLGLTPCRIIHEPLQRIHEAQPRPNLVIVTGGPDETLRDSEMTALSACLDRGIHVIIESYDGSAKFSMRCAERLATMDATHHDGRGRLILCHAGLSFQLLGGRPPATPAPVMPLTLERASSLIDDLLTLPAEDSAEGSSFR